MASKGTGSLASAPGPSASGSWDQQNRKRVGQLGGKRPRTKRSILVKIHCTVHYEPKHSCVLLSPVLSSTGIGPSLLEQRHPQLQGLLQLRASSLTRRAGSQTKAVTPSQLSLSDSMVAAAYIVVSARSPELGTFCGTKQLQFRRIQHNEGPESRPDGTARAGDRPIRHAEP